MSREEWVEWIDSETNQEARICALLICDQCQSLAVVSDAVYAFVGSCTECTSCRMARRRRQFRVPRRVSRRHARRFRMAMRRSDAIKVEKNNRNRKESLGCNADKDCVLVCWCLIAASRCLSNHNRREVYAVMSPQQRP